MRRLRSPVEETLQEAKEIAVQSNDKSHAETLSGPRRIERLERMEGLTNKIGDLVVYCRARRAQMGAELLNHEPQKRGRAARR